MSNIGDEQLSFIGYFSSDKHYLGASKAVKEGIVQNFSVSKTYLAAPDAGSTDAPLNTIG